MCCQHHWLQQNFEFEYSGFLYLLYQIINWGTYICLCHLWVCYWEVTSSKRWWLSYENIRDIWLAKIAAIICHFDSQKFSAGSRTMCLFCRLQLMNTNLESCCPTLPSGTVTSLPLTTGRTLALWRRVQLWQNCATIQPHFAQLRQASPRSRWSFLITSRWAKKTNRRQCMRSPAWHKLAECTICVCVCTAVATTCSYQLMTIPILQEFCTSISCIILLTFVALF